MLLFVFWTLSNFFVVDQPALQTYFLAKYNPFMKGSDGFWWWVLPIFAIIPLVIQARGAKEERKGLTSEEVTDL